MDDHILLTWEIQVSTRHAVGFSRNTKQRSLQLNGMPPPHPATTSPHSSPPRHRPRQERHRRTREWLPNCTRSEFSRPKHPPNPLRYFSITNFVAMFQSSS